MITLRTTGIPNHLPIPASRDRGGRRLALPRRMRETLASWRQRLRERNEMAEMTERDMRDAMLSPTQVRAEIRKPFWRA